VLERCDTYALAVLDWDQRCVTWPAGK